MTRKQWRTCYSKMLAVVIFVCMAVSLLYTGGIAAAQSVSPELPVDIRILAERIPARDLGTAGPEELEVTLYVRDQNYGIASVFYSVEADGQAWNYQVSVWTPGEYATSPDPSQGYENIESGFLDEWNILEAQGDKIICMSRTLYVYAQYDAVIRLSFTDQMGQLYSCQENYIAQQPQDYVEPGVSEDAVSDLSSDDGAGEEVPDSQFVPEEDFAAAENLAEEEISIAAGDSEIAEDFALEGDHAPEVDFIVSEEPGAAEELAEMGDPRAADDLEAEGDLVPEPDSLVLEEPAAAEELAEMEDVRVADDLEAEGDLAPETDFLVLEEPGAAEDLAVVEDVSVAEDLPAMEDVRAAEDLAAMEDPAVQNMRQGQDSEEDYEAIQDQWEETGWEFQEQETDETAKAVYTETQLQEQGYPEQTPAVPQPCDPQQNLTADQVVPAPMAAPEFAPETMVIEPEADTVETVQAQEPEQEPEQPQAWSSYTAAPQYYIPQSVYSSEYAAASSGTITTKTTSGAVTTGGSSYRTETKKDDTAETETKSDKKAKDESDKKETGEKDSEKKQPEDHDGSVYDISSVQSYLGQYLQSVEDLVIYEKNAQRILPETVQVLVSRNGEMIELEKDTDYTFKLTGSSSNLKTYKYTIDQGVFSEEGAYRVFLSSEDAAGVSSSNEEKDTPVWFHIDHTEPLILSMDPTDDQQTDGVREVRVKDNTQLDNVEIYLGDQKVEYESDGEVCRFQVPDDVLESDVKVVARDKAGNTYERTLPNYVQAGKAKVRQGSGPLPVILMAAAVFGIFMFLVRRRRKKRRRRA